MLSVIWSSSVNGSIYLLSEKLQTSVRAVCFRNISIRIINRQFNRAEIEIKLRSVTDVIIRMKKWIHCSLQSSFCYAEKLQKKASVKLIVAVTNHSAFGHAHYHCNFTCRLHNKSHVELRIMIDSIDRIVKYQTVVESKLTFVAKDVFVCLSSLSHSWWLNRRSPLNCLIINWLLTDILMGKEFICNLKKSTPKGWSMALRNLGGTSRAPKYD
jgi:hypothetical protein